MLRMMVSLIRRMSLIQRWVPRPLKNDKGGVAIEYALIVTFVALVLVVAAGLMGNNLGRWFNNMGTRVNGYATSAS